MAGKNALARLGMLCERLPRPRLGINTLLVFVALYLTLVLNHSFWHQVFARLPNAGLRELGLLFTLFVAINVLLTVLMLPLSLRVIVKPALGIVIVIASVCAYFMDAYGTVIDAGMIGNLFQTDVREAGELLSVQMIVRVVLTGVVPALLLQRIELQTRPAAAELLRRALLLVLALCVLVGVAGANYKNVSLWVREQRDIRLYINPSYPLYAFQRYLKGPSKRSRKDPVMPIAQDAVRQPSATGRPRVVLMVVGETARAANYSLLGYPRPTNPELAAEPGIVAYSQTWSCGTATAFSLPCMFSRLGRDHFSRSRAGAEETLLDVLQKTGVSVLWRDNNSDCKGVCNRVPSEDLRKLQLPDLCDGNGCRDEVLLHDLGERLRATRTDSFIVLHLLGSHGPSYFKRYPPAFRRFVPVCEQDDVQNCSREAIVNAYDNTILYTDHVLAELIALLKQQQNALDVTMIYVSDHGESLGENGIYLHGLPYALAPDEQKHVPMIIWAPTRHHDCIAARRDEQTSHDDLFPTVLGLFSIRTDEYRAERDLLRGC